MQYCPYVVNRTEKLSNYHDIKIEHDVQHIMK